MSKINRLFKADDVIRQQPVKKPSIKQQLERAAQEAKTAPVQTQSKTKKRNEPEH